MKIVMSTHHYPPRYVAGVELITQRLAGWLRDHSHTVEVVCVEEIDSRIHATVRTEVQDGIRVHRLGLKLWGMGEHVGVRFRDHQLGGWFDEYLGSRRPDIFHSQSSYLLSASLIESAKRNGVPVVATLHDYWYLCPRLTMLRSDGQLCTLRASPEDCTRCILGERRRYRFADKLGSRLGRHLPWPRAGTGSFVAQFDRHLMRSLEERQAYLDEMLRSVDLIVSPAPLARALLLERGFDSDHVRLIRYGLDLSRWRGLARTPAAGGLRIGYLGQLAPHKGVHRLIQAFQGLIARDHQPPELKIYGNPTILPKYFARLKALAADNPHIAFHGAYDNDRVEAIFTEVDVLVVPSVWFEINPLVIMEAFAAKVPVVASHLPNLEYQVRHGVDGLLFAPDNAVDLRRQLQMLVDNPELVREFADRIQPVRAVDDEMAELEDVYRQVMARRTQVGSVTR